MTKRSLLTGTFFVVLSLCFTNGAFPQATTGGTGPTSPGSVSPGTGSVSPDAIQGQPDFPDYIVTPREDLNPFGLSTLGKSTETGYIDAVGTLGTDRKRPSNIEVNSPRERIPSEEDVNQSKDNILGGSPEVVVETQSSVGESSSFRSAKKGGIYTWTDDEGILHVTNELGSVPPQYQQQFIDESSGNR